MKKFGISKKTSEIMEKKMSSDVREILSEKVVNEENHQKDIGKFILIVGILGPILALIQAAKIYFDQTAAGVSMVYWGSYLVMGGIWFGWGVSRKNIAIMFTYGLWIVVEIFILNLILVYR